MTAYESCDAQKSVTHNDAHILTAFFGSGIRLMHAAHRRNAQQSQRDAHLPDVSVTANGISAICPHTDIIYSERIPDKKNSGYDKKEVKDKNERHAPIPLSRIAGPDAQIISMFVSGDSSETVPNVSTVTGMVAARAESETARPCGICSDKTGQSVRMLSVARNES